MTAYYVLGVLFVLFALGLTALGMVRDDFPPTLTAGRALMAFAGILAVATFGVLLASTHREHPREEAAAEARAEKAAEEKPEAAVEGEAGGQEGGEKQRAGGPITVIEKEYSIDLPAGNTLEAGPYGFMVMNEGKVGHDLAIEGPSVARKKTPVIDSGERAELEAKLVPGSYTLVCTVPGHEELGMKRKLTVR